MKALIAVPLFFIALNTAADCHSERPSTAPTMPEAGTATQASMEQAQLETREYVDAVTKFLDCRKIEISDMTHNYFVYSATQTAEAYNQTLQQYSQRQEALAMN